MPVRVDLKDSRRRLVLSSIGEQYSSRLICWLPCKVVCGGRLWRLNISFQDFVGHVLMTVCLDSNLFERLSRRFTSKRSGQFEHILL